MASLTNIKADPYAVLRLPGFRSYLCGNLLATIGMQMLGLAVGWQLYLDTHSALVLGLAGLCQTLPILLLAIPSGRLVDHFDRKKLLLIDQLLLGFSAAGLGCVTVFQDKIPDLAVLRLANHGLAALAGLFQNVFHEEKAHFDSPYIPVMLALLFFNGMVRSVNQPVKQALVPQLVPAKLFFNAVGWNTTVVESSNIAGRALAGLLIAGVQSYYPESTAPCVLVYFLAAIGQLGQWLFLLPVKVVEEPKTREPLTIRSFFSGLGFVWNTQVILGVITLDLFSVLFGGATALLPMFAQDILHCGPAGLGWLSAAPGMGACLIGVLWAHLPPLKKAGRTLLLAVTGFGVSTIAFGLSRNFFFSLLCLFFVGICDNTSVIIRQTLVQIITPDAIRGRVSAVKSLFSSASNGLGAFESGLTASMFGPMASVVGGGLGAIFVVVTVAAWWPQVRRFGALHGQDELGTEAELASPDNLIELELLASPANQSLAFNQERSAAQQVGS
jgi:MFS family permease